MDFFDVVKRRRSCRKFTNKAVPTEVIQEALQAALLAPNSSNLQPWEFYWVQDPVKKAALVEACFSQSAAKTAQELVVVVARIDTWKRNRDLLLKVMGSKEKLPPKILDYYNKVIPFVYTQGPFGVLSLVKWPLLFLGGLMRPVPRGPLFYSGLFEMVSKTTALACENFMLSLVALGYDSCPMEGFDEVRVKKITGVRGKSHVVMVIGIGEADPEGIFGERVRLDPSLFLYKI